VAQANTFGTPIPLAANPRLLGPVSQIVARRS